MEAPYDVLKNIPQFFPFKQHGIQRAIFSNFLKILEPRGVKRQIQKFLTYSNFSFVTKNSVWWQFLHPRSIFTWVIGSVMHFYWFSGGSERAKSPEISRGFSGYFSTFSYLWNYFLLFLRKSGGEAPGKFLRFFTFLMRGGGGLPRIFPDFLMFEQKSIGGVQETIFSWRHFFGP